MSTRSSTVLLGSGGPWHLYRHCDGYPAEAVAAIVDACRNATVTGDTLRALLALQYDATSYCGPRPIYEPDYARADDIGDLEHVYVVELVHYTGMPRRWHVTHYARPSFDVAAQPYRAWPTWEGDLSAFVEHVNQNRREVNARLATLRRDYGGTYKNATDYPMLENVGTSAQVPTSSSGASADAA